MGLIGGFCHLYIGQEAVVVGLEAAAKEGDKRITSYRDHGHMLACGMDPNGVMAELTGRSGGYSKGKGGSMHMFSKEKNFYGGHGIVGAQVPLGAGLAFADKYMENESVTFTYFGDGAANQGQVYEVMNMAALWKLPVIYACENNGYSEYTSTDEIAAGEILERARAFGIEAFNVDGQDVIAVNKLASELVEKARKGKGPFFIELMTYRYHGHHVGDINRTYYRSKEEEAEWKKNRDPIEILGTFLKTEGIANDDELRKLYLKVRSEASEAVDYAINAAYPDPSEVNMHVFQEG
jgi:pyruvate dehydrogenase E1 component alpha subunit